MERVNISGMWYTVDPDSLAVSVNGGIAYATFDAFDELNNEDVKLQYISINRSRPDPQHPYRIIRMEEDEDGS